MTTCDEIIGNGPGKEEKAVQLINEQTMLDIYKRLM